MVCVKSTDVYRGLLHELFGALVPDGGDRDHPPDQVISEGVHALPDGRQQVLLEVPNGHRKDGLGRHFHVIDIFDCSSASQVLQRNLRIIFFLSLDPPPFFLFVKYTREHVIIVAIVDLVGWNLLHFCARSF